MLLLIFNAIGIGLILFVALVVMMAKGWLTPNLFIVWVFAKLCQFHDRWL